MARPVPFWLDPARPLAEEVAAYLLDALRRPFSLRDCLVVVPTLEAGRRLRLGLAARAAGQETGLLTGPVLTPLQVVTHGRDLPDMADDALVLSVWVDVLQGCPGNDLEALLPTPPPERDATWAVTTARMMMSVRRSLVEGGLRPGDVEGLDDLPGDERKRWAAIARLEARAARDMQELGRRDPLEVLLSSAKSGESPKGISRVVIAAVSDPTPLMIQAMSSWPDSIRVDCLIPARSEDRERFDEWGRPREEAWTTRVLDLAPTHRIDPVGGPAECTERVREFLVSAEEKALIGMPDTSLRSAIMAGAEQAGNVAHDPGGMTVETHPCGQLVVAYGQTRFEGRLEGLTGWLRHGSFLTCLERDAGGSSSADILHAWDDFLQRDLPPDVQAVKERLPVIEAGTPVLGGALKKIFEQIAKHTDLPLDEAISDLLATHYGDATLVPGREEDDLFMAAGRSIMESAQAFTQAARASGRTDPGEVFKVWWSMAGEACVYPAAPPDALAMTGWLELAWQDAPDLLVAGMNEGSVPDGQAADLFLPDSLRARLGLRSDTRRHARDAYLFYLLTEQRRRRGRLIWVPARTTEDGDSRQPSRLLLQCAPEDLVGRVRRLFHEATVNRLRPPPAIPFRLIPPAPGPAPARLRVTALRTYLTCPFEYYLSHEVGMERVETNKLEMSPADFGIVVHDTLRRLFTLAELHDCKEEKLIAERLEEELDRLMAHRFGRYPALHVMAQAEAMRQRLRAFASIQAAEVKAGWRIVDAERKLSMSLGGISLEGRIDRVDRHDDGRVRIIDYKTRDKAEDPARTHLVAARTEGLPEAVVEIKGKARSWIDLQLPLYARMLSLEMPEAEEITVGYANLPKAVHETSLVAWADLSGELVDAAVTCAEAVVGNIRDRVFWPPSSRSRIRDNERLITAGLEACFDPRSLMGSGEAGS
ncbi:MAG TPA: PD-(D/E)XK nuclease family protein [Kiritimatiellia bacterium]|nr:PD-(D/E)XK nuclease family protein [Kiritimatiellia bacterium]